MGLYGFLMSGIVIACVGSAVIAITRIVRE